jgi:hypothetical protein
MAWSALASLSADSGIGHKQIVVQINNSICLARFKLTGVQS